MGRQPQSTGSYTYTILGAHQGLCMCSIHIHNLCRTGLNTLLSIRQSGTEKSATEVVFSFAAQGDSIRALDFPKEGAPVRLQYALVVRKLQNTDLIPRTIEYTGPQLALYRLRNAPSACLPAEAPLWRRSCKEASGLRAPARTNGAGAWEAACLALRTKRQGTGSSPPRRGTCWCLGKGVGA